MSPNCIVMPEKEGSDDGKRSTKSVVNKKEKQFMNQEGLDLTKIAEAFGGYLLEKRSPEELASKMQKRREEKFGKSRFDSEKIGTSTPSDRKRERNLIKKDKLGTTSADKPMNPPAPPAFMDPESNPFDFPSAEKQKKSEKGFDDLAKAVQTGTTKTGSDAEKISKKPRRATRYRGKFTPDERVAKIKNQINKKEKDYQQRLDKASAKSIRATIEKGEVPAGTPLPAAPKGAPKGMSQKGQSDSDAEFNAQQNILRRLQRQGMADSGATPFKQPPLPDPKTGPTSKLKFSKFQQDQLKRQAQNKKDEIDASVYRQSPEYKLQTQQIDPDTDQKLSPDEIKRRFRSDVKKRKGAESEVQASPSKDEVKLNPNGGFKKGREGTLTRNKKSPNVETMPDKIGRKVGDMAQQTQTAQQSALGALGGFVTKSVSSSAAGAEAGMRYAQGDKTGATLSALQSMGGGLGFGAGVLNAIRSMRIGQAGQAGKTGGIQKFKGDPEKIGMAAAAGGYILPRVGDALRKAKNVGSGLGVKGGRSINVSAKS